MFATLSRATGGPGASAGPHDGWRADITGLRGLSVLLVLAYHLQLRGAGGGFIGVDVFFVVSGYLMTRIVWGGLERGDFGYWRFVGARAARIWPALGTMVLVLMLLGLVLLPPFDLEALAQQSVHGVLFGSNHFFHDRAGYNTQSIDTHWLLHTWTLSLEWQFYVLYPCLLWAVARVARRRVAALVTVGVLLLVSLACHALWSGTQPVSAFFLLPARAWELLAGGVVYLLAPVGGAPEVGPSAGGRARGWAGWAGVLLILGAALGLALKRVPAVGAGAWLVLPVLGAALVLWSGDAGNRLLRPRVLQVLGRWSYSIYLWHWPLIVGMRMTDVFLEHPVLASFAVSMGSIVLGAITYRWVERSTSARVGTGMKSLTLMAVAAAAAGALWSTQGVTLREPFHDPRSDVERNRSLYFPASCSNFMKTAMQSAVCVAVSKEGRRVLVIGDSHAEHLYPWFVAHSKVAVDFFTQAECPPVPNFNRMQSGFHCMDYAQAAWHKAAESRYDTIVVSARWATVGSRHAPYCYVREVTCNVEENVVQKRAALRAELLRAVRSLLAQGKTVVMVKPTPEARVRVPERLARELFWHGEVKMQIDRAASEKDSAWLSPMFESLQSTARFRLVDLNDKLCHGPVCDVFDSKLGQPIFIDESHFNPPWIAANGDAFEPFVQEW